MLLADVFVCEISKPFNLAVASPRIGGWGLKFSRGGEGGESGMECFRLALDCFPYFSEWAGDRWWEELELRIALQLWLRARQNKGHQNPSPPEFCLKI